MVCLDLTENDELLIRYSQYFCSVIENIEQLFFVHNIYFDDEEDAEILVKGLDRPLEEIILAEIKEKVFAVFKNNDKVNINFIVSKHSTTPIALNDVANENNINLAIVGKKISYRGSGLAVEKLLRIINDGKDVLMVPVTAYHQINNILTPIDFSKQAKKSLQRAAQIIEVTNSKIHCLHIANAPKFYFPYLASEDILDELENNIKGKWKKFKDQLLPLSSNKLDFNYLLNRRKSIAETIYDYAVRNNCDLIILSLKGKSDISAFIIGSTTLKLIHHDLHIPLLITK
jgi:nucleotide-binding universal stress UspA family protein